MNFVRKGPKVLSGMVFWDSVFVEVIGSDGHIFKFHCDDGYSLIWGVVGCIISVLECVVRLKKVESKTFRKDCSICR